MVRIEENQRKIEEMAAFRDDPKIDKIIRILRVVLRPMPEVAR